MAAKWKGPKPEKFAFVIEQRMNALLSQAVLQTGTLVINVFSPAGVGAGANLTIGERIKDKFDRAKFSSIIFDPCSGLATIQPAEQEAFYQTQFSATFDAYLD